MELKLATSLTIKIFTNMRPIGNSFPIARCLSIYKKNVYISLEFVFRLKITTKLFAYIKKK